MFGGGSAFVLGLIATFLIPEVARRVPQVVALLLYPGGGCVLGGLLMALSSRVGKLRLRDRMLDRLALAPDARVLDAGCGHGLLLVGAAHRNIRVSMSIHTY